MLAVRMMQVCYGNVSVACYDHNLLITANGSDYLLLSSAVTFMSGMTSDNGTLCVAIQIVDDCLYEEDEVFLFTIETVTPSSAVMIGVSEVNKTIQDNAGRSDSENLI